MPARRGGTPSSDRVRYRNEFAAPKYPGLAQVWDVEGSNEATSKVIALFCTQMMLLPRQARARRGLPLGT